MIALAAMLWGSDLLLRPNALSAGWSPAWVVLGEHLLLTLLFLPVLWRERMRLRVLTKLQWAALLFVAWGGSAVATWLYTKAFTLDFSQALTVVLLQKTQPIVAILLAWVVLKERRQPLFWVWGMAAFAGAYLLIGFQKTPSLSDIHARQALLALGASALWGAATVAGRSLSAALSPGGLAGVRFALAVPVLFALTLVPNGMPSAPTHTVPFAAIFLLLIVLLPDLLGMVLYYYGLRGTPASAATLAELCYPLTALGLAVFVQHTPVTLSQGIGLGLLILAVIGTESKAKCRCACPGKIASDCPASGYHRRNVITKAVRGDTQTMATEYSFDAVSKADPQEVKNAIQQAQREIETRFDFRGSVSEIEHDGKEKITLTSTMKSGSPR